MLKNRPSESIVMTKFWDWRFRFYYVKKLYNARLVELGFAVLQVDTDTVWTHDPFPMLRAMNRSSIICMKVILTPILAPILAPTLNPILAPTLTPILTPILTPTLTPTLGAASPWAA